MADSLLNKQSNSTAQFSDYQKAMLQAMNVPVYELREPQDVGDNDADSNRTDALDSVSDAPMAQPIAALDIPKMDESDDFIVQVLSVFNVKNSHELNITWQVHDSDTIELQDTVLFTPVPHKLRTPEMKKQLWSTLQRFFTGQQWS